MHFLRIQARLELPCQKELCRVPAAGKLWLNDLLHETVKGLRACDVTIVKVHIASVLLTVTF